MTNYQVGDVLLVDFPFTSSGSGKPRPALVILDSGDLDVVLARVTTQPYGGTFDVPVTSWQQSGLLAPCIIRLHKLATTLGAVDRQSVAAVLQQIASAW